MRTFLKATKFKKPLISPRIAPRIAQHINYVASLASPIGYGSIILLSRIYNTFSSRPLERNYEYNEHYRYQWTFGKPD